MAGNQAVDKKQQLNGLLQAGRWGEAKQLCTAICTRNPNDAEAWFMLAGINAQLGAFPEVVDCCRRLIALQPGNAGAYYNLGVALQLLERTEEAKDCYIKLIQLQPENSLAHANLGLVMRILGSQEDAIRHCRRALELQPTLSDAWNTLGLIHLDIAQHEEAIDSFHHALQHRSVFPEAQYNLGLCYQRIDRLAEAEACFKQALQGKPDYAEAWFALANVQYKTGRLEEAVTGNRRGLALNPRDTKAQLNTGNLLSALGRHDDAVAHLRRAIEIDPEFFDAYNNLGNALLDCDDAPLYSDEAEKCYLKASSLRPESAEPHMNLGSLLMDLGRHDESERCYRRAIELRPGYQDAISGLARLMDQRGEFDSALQVLRPFLDAENSSIGVLLAYARIARHFNCGDDAVARLEQAVKREKPDPRLQAEVFFALGKLYDEKRQYEQAFRYYQQANEGQAVRFDATENARTFDALIAAYSADGMAQHARATNRSKLPIFIVGMPRSGTSLVEQILASHPLVHGAGELNEIHMLTKSLHTRAGSPQPYPGCVGELSRKVLDEVACAHLDYLGSMARDVARVTDKMPHNFRGLGLIDQLFPGARVIHVKRHPMDTCLSIYFSYFNFHHPYATSLTSLGNYYRQYQRLMAHWRTVLRIPMLEVQYEELVEDQESTTRAMLEFCELDWDDQCLNFHQSRRVVKTPSYDQVRQPMYKKSMARWRHYEEFLEPLRNALAQDAPVVPSR